MSIVTRAPRAIATALAAVSLLGASGAFPVLAGAPKAPVGPVVAAPVVGTPALSATTLPGTSALRVSASIADPTGVIRAEISVDGGPWAPAAVADRELGGTSETLAAVAGGVVQVAVGYTQVCELLGDGTVVCAGQMAEQPYDTEKVVYGSPWTVPGVTHAKSISTGDAHACAVLGDHTVVCWGENRFGQLGANAGAAAWSGTAVKIPGISTAIAVAAGGRHSCALLADHTVVCWGENERGELGNGTTTSSGVPVKVSGLSAVQQIATGYEFACARTADGAVHCWGGGSEGELGNGAMDDHAAPVLVAGVATATGVTAGGEHACALLADQTVTCWGANDTAQLGRGVGASSADAAPVPDLAGVAQVDAGWGTTCVRLDDGKAACWGDKWYGALGAGDVVDPTIPNTVVGLADVASIDAGDGNTCALAADGSVSCWGLRRFGMLQDGYTDNRPVPAPMVNGDSVVDIAVGGWHTCVLHTDGTVACEGEGAMGQLGRDVDESPTLAPVSGITTATALATTYQSSCALLQDGTVMCWGDNFVGELGDGTQTSRSTPGAVKDLTGVTAIAAGDDHVCALLADTTVRCWGTNSNGQLGTGTRTSSSVPVAVSGLTGVTSLAAGAGHTCAVLADHSVSCWGRNDLGQLGNGLVDDQGGNLSWQLLPVPVVGLTDAVAITARSYVTCALRSTGGVMCWGDNFRGALGDGTTTDRNVPVTVTAGGMDALTATAVTTDAATSCALVDGDIRCWGDNRFAQMGTGNMAPHALGTVAGLHGVTQVTGNNGVLCATPASGTAWCWGNDEHNSMGVVPTASSSTPVPAASFGHLADGPHEVCVRATNLAGETSDGLACASFTVAPDVAAPSVTATPVATVGAGGKLSGTAIPATIGWSGSDPAGGSGVDHYVVQRRLNGGAWATVGASVITTSLAVSLPTAGTVQYQVQAVDGAGLTSAWKAGAVLTARLTQQNAATVVWKGTWAGITSASLSGGTAKWSKVTGASVSFTSTGRTVSLITTKGPGRGKVKIYLGTKLLATVDLVASTTTYRAVAWTGTWPTSAARTLRFVVAGTAGRPRVDVDGFVVVK